MLMISDNVWNEIKNIIPVKKSKVGRPQKDPKTVLSGIFYIIVTGAQWHQLTRLLWTTYHSTWQIYGLGERWNI